MATRSPNVRFIPEALSVVLACLLFGACGLITTGSVARAGSHARLALDSLRRSKEPLIGLVDMGSQQFYVAGTVAPRFDLAPLRSVASDLGGVVVNETWAQLEPARGRDDWQDLDASLAAVSSWNAAHRAHPLGVKLRIFGGFTAPAWAKSLDGAPLRYDGRSIGRWWTSPYRQAWSTFEHALAARYDPNPLVRAVAVTSCATITGEPFVMALKKPIVSIMEQAGWSPAQQQRCLDGILSDYSGWVHTDIDFPFNPYRTIVDGHPVVEASVTQDAMEACARSSDDGGPTCVLGNHGLRDTVDSAVGSAPVYAEIDQLWQEDPYHVSVYFQTYGPTSGADCTSMNIAINHHADSVEVWPQALEETPQATLTSWNAALFDGVPLSC